MPLIQIAISLVFVILIAWLVNGRIRTPESTRAIVNIVLTLIVVGMALWAINTYIPMAEAIKAILNIVVVVAVSVRVLQALGLWGSTVRLWRTLTQHASNNTAH